MNIVREGGIIPFMKRIQCMRDVREAFEDRIDFLTEKQDLCCDPPPVEIYISGFFTQFIDDEFQDAVFIESVLFEKAEPPENFPISANKIYSASIEGPISTGGYDEDPYNPYYYVYSEDDGQWILFGEYTFDVGDGPVVAYADISRSLTNADEDQPYICDGGRQLYREDTPWTKVCGIECIEDCDEPSSSSSSSSSTSSSSSSSSSYDYVELDLTHIYDYWKWNQNVSTNISNVLLRWDGIYYGKTITPVSQGDYTIDKYPKVENESIYCNGLGSAGRTLVANFPEDFIGNAGNVVGTVLFFVVEATLFKSGVLNYILSRCPIGGNGASTQINSFVGKTGGSTLSVLQGVGSDLDAPKPAWAPSYDPELYLIETRGSGSVRLNDYPLMAGMTTRGAFALNRTASTSGSGSGNGNPMKIKAALVMKHSSSLGSTIPESYIDNARNFLAEQWGITLH